MKDTILLELAKRWEAEAKPPMEKPTSDPTNPAVIHADGFAAGARECLRMCADTLRTLVQVLGDLPKS